MVRPACARGTPRDIINRLNAEWAKIAADPIPRRRCRKPGSKTVAVPPEQFSDSFIRQGHRPLGQGHQGGEPERRLRRSSRQPFDGSHDRERRGGMTKKNRTMRTEWLRPAGRGLAILLAFVSGKIR